MKAFEALYQQHASAVFRFAWGLSGDPYEAEDIVSETFVRLLTKAPSIKTRTALAYLLAVARNVIKDLWPLYQSNDLSSESRALIDTFLSQDSEFASVLQESQRISPVIPSFQLAPDQERRLLDEARERARMKLLIIGGAIAIGGSIMIIALGAVIFLMYSRSV